MLPGLRASSISFTSSAAALSFTFLIVLVIACLRVPVHALLRGDEGAPEWSSSSISTLELGVRQRKASSRRPSLLGDMFSLSKQLESSTLFRAAITPIPSSAPVGPPSLPLTTSSVPTPAGTNTAVCKKCREDGPSCTFDSQCPGYCVGGTAPPNTTCTINSDCPNSISDQGICQFTAGTCSEVACPTPSPTLAPTTQPNCTVECVFSGTDCTITPSDTCDDDSKTIQAALDSLQPGNSLLLSGYFIIKSTIYLPSYIHWILDGTMTLGDNATLDEVGFVNVTEGIDATRPTAISENPGGATNITMSGGTYYGNADNNLGTVRFINFVAVTNSSFHDMTIENVGDDSFSLGPESTYNECRSLIGKAAGGNALTDKGSYNKWYDCSAEDCASDGFTIKCRYSEFYRCIGRNNTGPGFGAYARKDGSPQVASIGEKIIGHKFYACEAYGNLRAGFSANIASNVGSNAVFRNNFIQGAFYNNARDGVSFRNKVPDGEMRDNQVDIVVFGNRGLDNNGLPGSSLGGLVTDISDSIVSAVIGNVAGHGNGSNNIGFDVSLIGAINSFLTIYNEASDLDPPKLRCQNGSNVFAAFSDELVVVDFNCAQPLSSWIEKKYYELKHGNRYAYEPRENRRGTYMPK